ncbi:bis(5'-nucleosyl)-tetraphosphatase (symmetrical) YqeK [Sporosarcina jeotgali]|uniref:bis(5'-nucleosyl)-tetraphosphatase (symmetrical) n=1 Tax=Sporosarcina jeotgali TaxID=3020056 RepID=A0ABZ0L059_9BACL|nr:bis(5'-nucleosyl)-tetraphosphatase (symmetrical) YqeK [Sporosarcina sp. B2O-1]WOV85488.1 bis(5'-nucleosyl)-tetraphosphatase (symmetrical) YqeK [Sporosarcina sp. B2O-1]
MEPANLIQELQQRMPQQRFQHVLRVTETAKSLAGMHGESIESAETAALFHDIAKYMDAKEMRELLSAHQENPLLFEFHKELWHAPAGALIAREEFGIQNEDVLNAIRFHTTGRANMTNLEMIIYIADMTEPGRDFPGVDQLRLYAEGPLDKAMRACIIHTVTHLIGKQVPVYPDSIECYNYFVK